MGWTHSEETGGLNSKFMEQHNRREKTSWQTKKQMERSSNGRYKKDTERYQFSEQQKRMEEAG